MAFGVLERGVVSERLPSPVREDLQATADRSGLQDDVPDDLALFEQFMGFRRAL
jgi:hypothetical protein